MIQIDILKSRNISDGHALMEVMHVLNQVLYSDEFKKIFFSEPPTSGLKGMTLQEIYDRLTPGKDLGDGTTDDTIWIYRYSSWKWFSKVVGYWSGGNVIYANAKFWNQRGRVSDASFILHEYSHRAGFSHRSATDYTSVPYSLNRIFAKAAKNMGIE